MSDIPNLDQDHADWIKTHDVDMDGGEITPGGTRTSRFGHVHLAQPLKGQ